MVKTLPDKYIRKAVFDAVNNITVDGETIFCYDMRLTGKGKDNYILLSTQINDVDKRTKCGNDWRSSILIEVYVRYKLTGNTGSRLLADNIMEEVKDLTDSLTLDVASDLDIVTQAQSFPSDLVSTTNNQIIVRKFMRIEFLIE